MREVERELAECRGMLTALAERLSDQALTPEDRAYAVEVDGLLASASADIDDPMVWCKRLAKEIEYARFATRSGLHSYTLVRTSIDFAHCAFSRRSDDFYRICR